MFEGKRKRGSLNKSEQASEILNIIIWAGKAAQKAQKGPDKKSCPPSPRSSSPASTCGTPRKGAKEGSELTWAQYQKFESFVKNESQTPTVIALPLYGTTPGATPAPDPTPGPDLNVSATPLPDLNIGATPGFSCSRLCKTEQM